jgi:hypothetical protein
VEWNIGESAGMLAAHAIKTDTPPRGIRNDTRRLEKFQALLRSQAIELEWPRVTPR